MLNDLFRFSTTTLHWEQLDASLVSGDPPSPRNGHGMVAVGSDFFVFGGSTEPVSESGEEVPLVIDRVHVRRNSGFVPRTTSVCAVMITHVHSPFASVHSHTYTHTFVRVCVC